MLTRLQEAKLKIAIKEIIQGYSIVNTEVYPSIYIKHFSVIDTAEMDIEYDRAFKQAVGKGLPTAEQQVKSAIERGEWSDKKEKRIKEIPEEIETLKKTRSKTAISRERKIFTENIEDLEKELKRLESHKILVVGYTAEVFAARKANEVCIYTAFRKSNIKDYYFDKEFFDELDEEKLNYLIKIHNEHILRFSIPELKRMAISPIFMNMINMAGEDILSFYGKPVVDLTHQQLEMYSLGRHYRALMMDNKTVLTEELIENPDKLEELSEAHKAAEELGKQTTEETSGISITGATKEDLDRMGLKSDTPVTNLQEEAAKSGGSLSFEQLLKLHGI